MKKSKIPEMIIGYEIKPQKSEHYIWIKRICENGTIYFSKHICFNSDFYSRMMKIEFEKRG